MNDQDKVLISAYLDNELTQEENSYVESLIKEDSEAFNYLNKIKEINNQTESFFQEALNTQKESFTKIHLKKLFYSSGHCRLCFIWIVVLQFRYKQHGWFSRYKFSICSG